MMRGMAYIETDVPPPLKAPSLREMICQLEPGQSLCAPDSSLETLKTTVSRIKRYYHPDRTFTTRKTREGGRVWRLT